MTVTVNPIPAVASVTNVAICASKTATITATPGTNGNSIRWYTVATGGTALYAGTSYTTGNLYSTTIYYAEALYHNKLRGNIPYGTYCYG